RAGMVTTIIGGTGSDTINVGGDVVGEVVTADADMTGSISHGVTSDDPRFNGIVAPGVSATATTSNAASLDAGDGLVVVEGGPADSYHLTLPQAPLAGTKAVVTVSAPEGLLVSLDGVNFAQAVTVGFTAADWAAGVEVWVKAVANPAVTGNTTR